MAFRFGARSEAALRGVNPRLVAVARLALEKTEVDFAVLEGLRSANRQRKLYAAKATRTLRSKHLNGNAIDIAPVLDGQIRWDWSLYRPVAKAMKAAARQLGVKIQWGGDWKTFRDGPHFELVDEPPGA